MKNPVLYIIRCRIADKVREYSYIGNVRPYRLLAPYSMQMLQF